MAGRRTGERGAALLLVMVAVAVLTALAVDLAYDARVTLRIAANGRDELRAGWAAKGGVSLARLVLSLQKQIDDQMKGAAAVATGIPRPVLWRLVPVDSSLAGGLFEGGERAGPPVEFHATIDDESMKANAQLDSTAQSGVLGAQVEELYRLVCDARWDALFDREDESGNRVSRQDLLVYLHDWVTPGTDSSALAAQFPAGTCEIQLTRMDPFEPAGGDKNQAYDRGRDRYRTKNARMDSLDELYLVAGVTDAFMAAFGDRLSVYLPRDAKRNVNATDRLGLVADALAIASPKIQPALYDPLFAESLQKAVFQATAGGMLAMTPAQFGAIVQMLGVKIDANLVSPTSTNSPLTDTSTTYSIRAEATSGAVTKKLEAVVRLDSTGAAGTATLPGQPNLGRLVHWHEE